MKALSAVILITTSTALTLALSVVPMISSQVTATETMIAGTSVRSGVAAAAVAAAVTDWALVNGTRGEGSLVGAISLGDARLPTADLLEAIVAAGVPLSEFTGRSRLDEG